METMQWSEITTGPSSPTSPGVVNSIGGNDQHRNPHHNHAPGGPSIAGHGGSENSIGGPLGAPTIKNHSVTYFNDHLYCFGGYDGRRNHNLLLLYNIREQRWIRPQTVQEDEFNNNAMNNIDSDNINASIARVNHEGTDNTSNNINRRREISFEVNSGDDSNTNGNGNENVENEDDGNENGSVNDDSNDSAEEQINQPQEVQNRQPLPQQRRVAFNNNPYNRDIPPRNDHDGFFAGIDGNHDRRNSNAYAYTMTGSPPPGRNGHSATLATDEDDDNDEDEQRGDISGRIIVLGGWLGQGPLAASDMHVLDISRGGRTLRWYQPAVKGTPPGPCNMHSADYVKARKEVFVFRGGNGREYLNDVHALHVPTMTWRKVVTTGESPQQRANHSSCILEETGEIFVFGGWNGTTRLNDIHIFDTKTCNWTCPKVGGVLPHPRAGMTLTALRGRLYLFGGSGTSSKCFQDLQILDREEMSWLDVTQYESIPHGNTNTNGSNNHHNHQMQHPNYHQRNHFALPHPSQHYYTHSQQHQNYQHHHNNHQSANHQDNGFVPSNPQWNIGGQGYHDYGHQSHHQYHLQDDSNNHMNNRSNFGGNGAYTGAGMIGGYQPHRNISNNDDDTMNHPRPGSFTSSRDDWTSRELAARSRSMGTGVIASPNPNDEDSAPSVLLHGHRVPGSRAGHTATAVNRKIYIFGGSCGSDYLNDFYVLDTDPPPRTTVSEATSSNLIGRRLWYFFNDEEFSDVTFLVQGRRVYGHKMVLALVSDCFRAMFTAGFRESSSSEIEITGCSYEAFLAVLEYVYTGAEPSMKLRSPMSDHSGDGSRFCLGKIVDILELADRFFLDHLKQVCETQLQSNVRADTVEYLLQVAQKTNAMQLQAICEHFTRNRDFD